MGLVGRKGSLDYFGGGTLYGGNLYRTALVGAYGNYNSSSANWICNDWQCLGCPSDNGLGNAEETGGAANNLKEELAGIPAPFLHSLRYEPPASTINYETIHNSIFQPFNLRSFRPFVISLAIEKGRTVWQVGR